MPKSRHIKSVGRRKPGMPLLAAAMLAGYLAASPAYSATFGHSRLVSAVGESLRITIPVSELTAAEAESLRIVPAPAPAWHDAGLAPPVDLATLQTQLADGYAAGARVIHVWSDQVFSQPIADLLLDIHTSSGVQRYQVSLLARGGTAAVQPPMTTPSEAGRPGQTAGIQADTITPAPVLVRRGDTMFSVARRHAVSGVTVYQLMMALHRTNPKAFIHQNVNLVKAGERLVMPDMDALTAISDREARRLFHEQVVAFNAYRQGQGQEIIGDVELGQGMMQADQSPVSKESVSNIPESRTTEGDQLKLSSGRPQAPSDLVSSSTDVAVPTPATAGVQGTSADPGNRTGATEISAGNMAQSVVSGVSKTAHAASNNVSPDSAAGVDSALAVDQRQPSVASDNGNSRDQASSSTGDTAKTESFAPTSSGGTAVSPGQASVGDGSEADDAVAARKAIQEAETRVSMLEENVKNLNQALQSQGEAAIDVVVDGAIGLRHSLTEVATAVTDATIGDDDSLDESAAGQTSTDSTTQISQNNSTTSMMETLAAWVHANLIGVITAILALIVLVIAWVLRRANIAQSRTERAVTPEMVTEKLNEINLDLNEPTVGDSSRRT